MRAPRMLLLLSASLAVAACGEAADVPPPGAITPAPTTTEGPPAPPPAAKRTLVTSRSMGTFAQNLVVDPTFGSANAQYANALYASGAQLEVETPPTSPGGIAQRVLVMRPDGDRPALIVAVQGGGSAFDARVWVSAPTGTTPDVYLTSSDGRDTYELDPGTKDQVHGDRTYKLYSARITTPIYGKLYMIVEASKPVAVSAPEVAAQVTIEKRADARRVQLSTNAARALHEFTSRPIVPGPTKMMPSAGRILPPRL